MAGKKDLERLRRRRRRKQRIIRATVHLFVWLGMAVLYYVGFSVFFALRDAIAAAGDGRTNPPLRAPATPEAILDAIDAVRRPPTPDA